MWGPQGTTVGVTVAMVKSMYCNYYKSTTMISCMICSKLWGHMRERMGSKEQIVFFWMARERTSSENQNHDEKINEWLVLYVAIYLQHKYGVWARSLGGCRRQNCWPDCWTQPPQVKKIPESMLQLALTKHGVGWRRPRWVTKSKSLLYWIGRHRLSLPTGGYQPAPWQVLLETFEFYLGKEDADKLTMVMIMMDGKC